MAEEFIVSGETREQKYAALLPQLQALLDGEKDTIANMGNVCAALKTTFNFLWVGFYLVRGEELVLGPFQGPVACTRIGKGKGVCGASWQQAATVVVPDVDQFPGHIACSSLSRSEIVVPLLDASGRVTGVLDVDSEVLSDFDAVDARYLEQVVALPGLQMT